MVSSTPVHRRRFVILISGRGSNMQAIVKALQQSPMDTSAEVVAVIANREDAAGLRWAQQQGLVTAVVPHRAYNSREAFDQALGDCIASFAPDYVLLAGFMRILTPGFVQRFRGQIINIHPSLLPAFPGLHTHQQAIQTGVQWHGCTVHVVTPLLDNGPIIAQGVVPVIDGDTPADLAQRVLTVEHAMYGKVAGWLAQGKVKIDEDDKVRVVGVPVRAFYADGSQVNDK